MKTSVNRQTVDLSQYPELVVIYLGMRVRALTGLKTLLGLGPQIDRAGGARPDGLLHYENNIIFSLFPLHLGMRWYWRDLESMENWTRSEPHRQWWQQFLKGSAGTSFWHETYYIRGGMEAIYADNDKPLGFQAFAPMLPAKGKHFSARQRLTGESDTVSAPEGTSEQEIY